jgi:hypothetical protein
MKLLAKNIGLITAYTHLRELHYQRVTTTLSNCHLQGCATLQSPEQVLIRIALSDIIGYFAMS